MPGARSVRLPTYSKKPMTIRLLLADDHRMVREGLACLFEPDSRVEVVAEAATGLQAVEAHKAHRPDVTLMDISMPTMSGVEATRRIKEASPDAIILALSMHGDRRYVGQMLRTGAAGYILKTAAFEELILAIQTVARGGTYLDPAVANIVVSCYVRGESEETAPAFDSLTPREREVMQLFSEGYASKQIAGRLKVSVKTIDTHRYQVMRKLNLRGMADLTRLALREGISTLDGMGAEGLYSDAATEAATTS